MVTKKNKTVKTAKTVTAKEAPSHHTGPAKTERRLYRSGKDKMLAGVCGGLAEYLNIDVVWIRLFFILMRSPTLSYSLDCGAQKPLA